MSTLQPLWKGEKHCFKVPQYQLKNAETVNKLYQSVLISDVGQTVWANSSNVK
jgi:hypothetical protein